MIRNIVFDMGNVLMNYNPMKVCIADTNSHEDAVLIKQELFGGKEWKQLDIGSITEQEAMNSILTRLPERLHDSAKQCMMHWHKFMTPMEDMREVIADLRAKKYNIYLCSNASLRFFRYQNKIPGIEYFDGILISAQELCIKPEKEIYYRLFDKFKLDPKECFFIDDLEENIQGASHCGMKGYCFADGDIEKLKKTLSLL